MQGGYKMHFSKIKKTLACALAITLIMTVTTTGMTVHATNTTAKTTQSVEGSGGGPGDGQSGAVPSGGGPSGEAPSGEAPSGEAPSGEAPSGGGMGGANTMTYDYTGTLSGALTADGEEVKSDSESYTASTADQNAALAQNAGTLTITNGTFNKSGDDTNGDNCNFYGLNSILLAVNSGSAAYISDSSLSAESEGSNAIFATDSATVYANNDTINTTAGNSRGLDATYGGTILANLMTISTQGDHCASIATDRGGGYISTTNSTLSTKGSGSPLLYSTGDIEVDNVTGTSVESQIAGMEGLNTILISNSTLTSTNPTTTGSDPIADGIIIYQSTSGDAETTTGKAAAFEVTDSTLSSAITSGAMFYCTNTDANIVLSNTTLDFDSSNVNLMTIQGNDANNWGTAGSNGADVKFTGLSETLKGNIDVDTISSLNMFLLESTTYTGATTISTNAVNTDASSAPITMNLDGTSKWVVTGDSTVTDLNAENGATIVDEDGNTVNIVANGSAVVSGTSAYTITVTGNYSTSVTTDSSNQLSTSYIDRTAFDEYYGVSTTFGENSSSGEETVSVETVSEETTEAQTEVQTEPQKDNSDTDSNNMVMYVSIAAIVVIVGGGVAVWYKKKKK
jgi:trimeric autotransporter adhesin